VVKHKYYYTARSPFDFVSKDTFYKLMHDFTIRFIKELGLISSKTDISSEETKAVKQWCKMIIFEIVHEKAWPITIFSTCRNIKSEYDVFPIDRLIIDDDSNIKTIDQLFSDPTLLSNLYNKIRSGFFDNVNNTSEYIIQKKFRTSKYLVKAVKKINDLLKCKLMDDYDIFNLILDNTNADEYIERGKIDIIDQEADNYLLEKGKPANKNDLKWVIEPTGEDSDRINGGNKSIRKKVAK
jgi:hypothetical protein